MNPGNDKIRIAHWWPGRQYQKDVPIPANLIEKAMQQGSRYLTYASYCDGNQQIGAWAFCCPKDTPSREMGRRIALGRLQQARQRADWRNI